MIKVLIVFGTRPEAIKMAPLVRALKHPDQQAYFDARVCVTGQHRQMLDQVMEVFGIVPEYDLNIMKAGQDLFDITSAVLLGMRSVLDTFNPIWFWCTAIQGPAQRLPLRLFTDRWRWAMWRRDCGPIKGILPGRRK